MDTPFPHTRWLLLGDVSALALVTVAGFATHGELPDAGWRMATTFIPLLVAWLCAGGALGCLRTPYTSLVRLGWALLLTAPLAAWLRGLWLMRPIPPIFVLVLGGFTA
ncbi:MAG: DUF3054 family protein, partial [Anaerolineae bacterium]